MNGTYGTPEQSDTRTRVGPLHGVRIIDMTKVIMGPLATQILADQGAEVITVEGPGVQTNRIMGGSVHDEISGIALNLLRNKRSVELDLSSPDGRSALARLIATADVLVTTLRPGSMRRLGLSYEELSAVNPSLVYCHAQGWPVGSGAEDAPAYDDIIQAASGVADITQRVSGTPSLFPTILADKVAGMMVAQVVTAALYDRTVTGEGQRVEVPMVQTFSSFMLVEHGSGGINVTPEGAGEHAGETSSGYGRILTPQRRPHATTDGYVHMLPYVPEHYRRLFEDFGDGLDIDVRHYVDKRATLRNSHILYGHVREIVASRDSEFWLDYCGEHGIPVTRVRSLDEMLEELPVERHPEVGEYRVTQPFANFERYPFDVRRPAPLKGADSSAVLDVVAERMA